MKTSLPLSFFAALILALCGCESAPATGPHGKVVVNFDHPENFTDVKASYGGSTDQGYLDVIRLHLENRAGPLVPVDRTLTVTFTDIDLAGDIRPTRTGDVRIVKNIYPPRMNFRFSLTDASGKVVKEGTEKLVNLFPEMQTGIGRDEMLFYEKEMLNDWARKTLR
jgi:hypothetical protein